MTPSLIACHACDLLHRVGPLPEGTTVRCRRCASVLYFHYPKTVDRTLALSVSGLILLVIANLYPFLSIESQGAVVDTTLITGTIILSRQSMTGLALLVLLTSMLIPCFFLAALVYVLGSMKRSQRLPHRRSIFRLALMLRPWSMTEIFLLGILVALVKLGSMATIIPGTALFAFLALVFVLAAVNTFLDPHTIWEDMER